MKRTLTEGRALKSFDLTKSRVSDGVHPSKEQGKEPQKFDGVKLGFANLFGPISSFSVSNPLPYIAFIRITEMITTMLTSQQN
jgi:hypothetical protein